MSSSSTLPPSLLTPTNKHSASGSFLGYLFQIERVIHWLSVSDVEIVGLETDDDIVATLKGLPTLQILEQAKNSVSSTIPYADQSVDLWKTLSIWVEGVVAGRIDISRASFSLVTNKKIPSTRLIKKIFDAKSNSTSLDLLYDELITNGRKAKSKTKPFAEVVISANPSTVKDILRKIEFISSETPKNIVELKKHIRSNLAISEKMPFDFIYEHIHGFVINYIIEKWKTGSSVEIPRDLLLQKVNDLVGAFLRKGFVERTVTLLPLSREEVERNKGKLFVEQLRAINCDDDDIVTAVNDFLRASIEKARYADELEILDFQFEEYYNDLKDYWKSIYKPMIRSTHRTPEDIGYEIYYATIKYRGRLNNHEPEQSYTHKGAYHHLANLPELGWFPEWEKRFKK